MLILARERPPLHVAASITTPDGHVYRWAPDEHRGQNVMTAASWGDAMPGGFSQANITLPRDPRLDYHDITRLSTVRLEGVGGRVAWEGRIDQVPSQSGDQEAINPALTGWQDHLNDDNTARMIYVDVSLANWTGASVQRQINLLNAGWAENDASVSSDPSTGEPALIGQLTGAWTSNQVAEGWYDAKGISLETLYAAWKLQTPGQIGDDTSAATDPAFTWKALLSDDDVLTAADDPGNLRSAGPGTVGVNATTYTRKWGLVQLYYVGAGGTDGVSYPIYWTCLAVYGAHGLPLYGPLTQTSSKGLLSSDIEAHAVRAWAPELTYSTGPNGTVQPSSFVIPQMVFTDPGTAGTIVKGATAFELRDWAVWEDKTYWSNAYGAVGKQWQARVGPAQLQNTGPAVSRLFNGVVVSYTDVTGVTRTVGPPGTVTDLTDASLHDPDPTNPANQLGINRYGLLQMGTSTPAGAIQTGAIFLQYQKLTDRSGTASIVGHVQDQAGNFWPAWAIRSGDTVVFTDAADTSPRRVVSKTYDDPTKTASLQLDAPPDGMSALLSRLGVSLTSLGLS